MTKRYMEIASAPVIWGSMLPTKPGQPISTAATRNKRNLYSPARGHDSLVQPATAMPFMTSEIRSSRF